MSTKAQRSRPLTVEGIVEAAYQIVQNDGLGALSMRKLGTALDVDAMAVYHHVASKQALLALVTARALSEMAEPPSSSTPWDRRIEQWALGYWDIVTKHRELTLAGLSNPEIAAGGLTSTNTLLAAISDSGLATEFIEPTMFIIVDAVHGSALGAASPGRDHTDLETLRAVFQEGLHIIIAGITTRLERRTDSS
jgi:AcrR family transcriptional regulator